MKISEIFYSQQFEIDIGIPSIFIRGAGCNLIQQKNGCLFCDSKWAERGKEMSIGEIVRKIKSYNCKNLVFTGGEPLLQADNLLPLLVELKDDNYNISIETNGTIYKHNVLSYIDKINCSPKKQQIEIDILRKFLSLSKDKNVRFKFVYENKKECKWFERIISDLEIPSNLIWIMPCGKTRKEQMKKQKEVVQYCLKKGYNFTFRGHILIWNNKKGV